jgi:microcystin-dependent protein
MSCNSNNGWGCGCQGTVQYAPSACNPNFPTTCTALGTGTIQRVVGEDSSYCKYTVPTLASNSLLFYNASTGLINWANGTTANPVYLSPSTTSQTSGNLLGLSALSGNNGQVVEVMPTSPVTQATFPIVPIGGSTVNWGTIENLIPNTGLVYRNNTGTVAQLSAASGNIVTFDANGNPIAESVSILSGATAVPSGAVLPFAYNVTSGTLPAGWLLCDGAVYTVAAYPTLGALLANTYGGSSGTFAVPNLSGLFIRGSGTQTTGGITYAAGVIGTVQTDAFQGHFHSGNKALGASGVLQGGTTTNLVTSGNTTGAVTDGTSGTPRTNTETRPVNLAMVYCIKI